MPMLMVASGLRLLTRSTLFCVADRHERHKLCPAYRRRSHGDGNRDTTMAAADSESAQKVGLVTMLWC